jgi:hypothetical protein
MVQQNGTPLRSCNIPWCRCLKDKLNHGAAVAFCMALHWYGMVPLTHAHTAAWALLGEPAYNKLILTVQNTQTLIGQLIQYKHTSTGKCI